MREEEIFRGEEEKRAPTGGRKKVTSRGGGGGGAATPAGPSLWAPTRGAFHLGSKGERLQVDVVMAAQR